MRVALWTAGAITALSAVSFAAANGASASVDLGRATYSDCSACHGKEGLGGVAPPFAGNERLKITEYVISHILNGSANMPTFKDQLSNVEIAAVINHVRTSWGNGAERISSADVAKVRQQRSNVPQQRL